MGNLDDLLQENRPLVVGAVSDPSLLRETISPDDCDLIELRLDALGPAGALPAFCQRHAGTLPLLLTARHPAEGGAGALSAPERAAALAALLDSAAAIDLELRSLPEPEPGALWSDAGARGITRIASFHDFESTPELDVLTTKVRAASAAGADIGKLAFRLTEPGELHTLAALLRITPDLPLSVMGMGPLAPASRLLAMQLGSVLNYGYLGQQPTAPGQWPARLLKQALAASV